MRTGGTIVPTQVFIVRARVFVLTQVFVLWRAFCVRRSLVRLAFSSAGRAALWATLGWLPVAPVCGAELLPDVSVHLKAARYFPAETDLHWDTWIGAGAGLLRVGGTTAYFTADVETTIGNTRRAFDATQANYHLETGVRHEFGHWQGALVLHHVSRHLTDSLKVQAVDWNVLGVRASTRVQKGPVPLSLILGAGHTIQDSLVGYRWEVAARLTADVLRRPWGQAYLRGDLRGVTVERSELLPRGRFLDASAEGGARFPRGPRSLELYVSYEHRNDVLLLEPSVRNRTLVGFRIGMDAGRTPAELSPTPLFWP